ncbi:LOW QUALITY PROTEIN: hypothetical protein Cgig2_032952 [Carnegiea gigantea]|uniref:Uncharacterized protein n=1 Tax=Carnegiea gigantea TaxID=171969 RepID=A0A9Q1GSR6_9CARY|nr:LOW QUALITY PROTEIN: hypothetical protein Cgig2_032952 [Carnegiea gigantea]
MVKLSVIVNCMLCGRDSKKECQLGEEWGATLLKGSSFGTLLSNPNDNELEGQKNATEAVDKDVHEGLSNNSKIITQPLNNAQCRPIYVGKLTSQMLMKRLLAPYALLVVLLKWNFNSIRTVNNVNFLARTRRVKISKSSHNSPTPTEIAEEALQLEKRLGISIIDDETPVVRRITRSLRKALKNKRQARDVRS